MRRAARLALGLALGAALLLAAWAGLGLAAFIFLFTPGNASLPPLLAGLPPSNLAAQRAVTPGALQARAAEAFPAGTPEGRAAAALEGQGFRDRGADAGGTRWFRFRRENFPCDESYDVGWRGDAAGRIGEVATRFHSTCL